MKNVKTGDETVSVMGAVWCTVPQFSAVPAVCMGCMVSKV
jgi:hypothetical protein